MKFLLCAFCFLSTNAFSQAAESSNIFIITTDGFRWQEIFSGADEQLVKDPRYVKDTTTLSQLYWSDDINERRKMLMPFTWNLLAKQGSIFGNRKYGNKVSVANPYRFSYAGYNEIFTGQPDYSIIANKKRWNSNENVLDFINRQPEYSNKVAAFTSWNLFTYILNKRKTGIYLNSGYQHIDSDTLTETEGLVNGIQENLVDTQQHCRNDMLTFITAKEYIQKNHPKIVYISFGETDEWAHHRNYDEYLNSAHLFDDYLAQIWNLINKDPFYKNNTAVIITTDHGRGEKTSTWAKHGPLVSGSKETWLMVLGKNMPAKGEVKYKSEIFSEQLAETITHLLGYDVFTEEAASPIYSLLINK
jgi:hypothetical protein